MTAQEIKQRLETELPGARVEVWATAADNRHFGVKVAAPQFNGLPLVQQHRRVNEIFKEALYGSEAPIHAFQLETSALAGV